MLQRNKILFSSLFRIVVSLCMAVIMFLSYSFHSHAQIGLDGDIVLNLFSGNPLLVLDFFANYTSEGSDRDSDIPYTFDGSSYMSFSMARQGNTYLYLSGYASKIVTYSRVTESTGVNYNVTPRPYISSVSLPEGISVYISSYSGNADSFSVTYTFSFDNVDISNPLRGGFTVGFYSSGYAPANYFGSSYGYVQYNYKTSNDYSGNLRFGTVVTDFDSTARFFYNRFNDLHTDQQNIYSRLNTINNSITSQTDTLSARLHDIDFNNVNNYRIIENNQQSIINRLNANSTAEINNATVNSKNEIDTANKNADDIMNSYDSASQGSDNKRFDDSQKELQETEDNLFGSATGYFDAVDFTSAAASLVTIASSLSFVSGLMQQFYVKSGVFGMIVTISLVVMIASKIIGLYRFSTGGDGKGG